MSYSPYDGGDRDLAMNSESTTPERNDASPGILCGSTGHSDAVDSSTQIIMPQHCQRDFTSHSDVLADEASETETLEALEQTNKPLPDAHVCDEDGPTAQTEKTTDQDVIALLGHHQPTDGGDIVQKECYPPPTVAGDKLVVGGSQVLSGIPEKNDMASKVVKMHASSLECLRSLLLAWRPANVNKTVIKYAADFRAMSPFCKLLSSTSVKFRSVWDRTVFPSAILLKGKLDWVLGSSTDFRAMSSFCQPLSSTSMKFQSVLDRTVFPSAMLLKGKLDRVLGSSSIIAIPYPFAVIMTTFSSGSRLHKENIIGTALKSIALLLCFIFLLLFLLGSGVPIATQSPLAISSICSKTSPFETWQTHIITPNADGHPQPFEKKYELPVPLKLSLVGLDTRDTVLGIYIDGSYTGSTSDVVVDNSISCGEDLRQCVSMGMTQGQVVLPQGRHTIHIACVEGKAGVNWKDRPYRKFMWEIELCS